MFKGSIALPLFMFLFMAVVVIYMHKMQQILNRLDENVLSFDDKRVLVEGDIERAMDGVLSIVKQLEAREAHSSNEIKLILDEAKEIAESVSLKNEVIRDQDLEIQNLEKRLEKGRENREGRKRQDKSGKE